MKRINSNSWKKPFDGDLRPSQDSAYNSSQDRIHNSQCMEFSQVSTQDLFGHSSQSQKEQGNPKINMYEKWLSKRSFSSKPNQRDISTPGSSWTSMGADVPGSGRAASKITTPSSHLGFSGNKLKLKSDEKDEQREVLEMVLSSFHESEQQIRSLSFNLQEMMEKMGMSFNNDTKAVLSSFMEDITKSHDNLLSHVQGNEKYKDTERELENQLVSKKEHIASLESKLKLLDDQFKKTESDESRQNKDFQEIMKSSHEVIMKRIEEMTEAVGCHKEQLDQFRLDVGNIKEEVAAITKGVQTISKESENRILKEMKKGSKDTKSNLDIMRAMIEGIGIEIGNSLKTKLQSFSKDIKDEFSKEHKRYNEQVLRKQFDRMHNKMDSVVAEHKKMHHFVATTAQDSISHHIEEIDKCVRSIKDKSSGESTHMKQMQQRIANSQEKQSQLLENMIIQQKEFCEHIKGLLKNESRKCTSGICQDRHHSDKSDAFVNSNTTPRQENEVNERHSDGEESNLYYQRLRNDPSPSNNLIHKVVDTNVSNTYIPVINQTNIYSSSRGQNSVFKSPYPILVNKTKDRQYHKITDWSDPNNGLQVPFDCNFKRLAQTFSKHTLSPVAAIKPQSRSTRPDSNMTFKDVEVHNNESCKAGVKNGTNNRDRCVQQKTQLELEPSDNENTHANGYWLRKRNGMAFNEGGCITLTPRMSKVRRQPLNSRLNRQNLQRSTERPSSNTAEHTGRLRSDISCESIKQMPHFGLGGHIGNWAGRKRQFNCLDEKEDSMTRHQDISIYDFQDDDVLQREQLSPYKRIDEERSSISSPALTINLNWVEMPSLKRKRHGMDKSGLFQTIDVEDNESSILDL